MDNEAGRPGPAEPARGRVNGSARPGSADGYGYLAGMASRRDLDVPDDRGARRGRHRGAPAGSPPPVTLWSYQADEADEADDQWLRDALAHRNDRLPHGSQVPSDTPPVPWVARPPVRPDNRWSADRRLPANPVSDAPAAYRGGFSVPAPTASYLPPRRRQAPVSAVPSSSAVNRAQEERLAVPEAYPYEGMQLAPLGRNSALLAQGSGPKLGLRAAMAALAAVVVLAAIGYGVYATAETPLLTTLSAQVASTGQVALGFPQAGVLSRILIRPGEHVAAGQVLATEVVAGLDQQVAADREAVQTDKFDIAQLQALLNEVNQQATSSATAGVSSAADVIGSTQSARQAAISAFQAEVGSANQTLQTDESTYAKMCHSSSVGAADCESFAHLVAADKQSLASAKANLSAQQAAQADWEAEANRLLSDQKTAQGDSTLALVPLEVDLGNARNQLTKDQAQLKTDQAKEAEEDLKAPQAGTVVSVDGEPGEVVSGTGVSGGNTTGGQVSVRPGFEMFPSEQSSAGSQASSPVAVLQVGGPLLVNVVVPESQIGLVHIGASVTITPTVTGPRPTHGVVSEIFPTSIVAAGVVSYEVQVKASSQEGRSGWLPGMTATATISH